MKTMTTVSEVPTRGGSCTDTKIANSSPSSSPRRPALSPSLRLATVSDIRRLSVVAAAGFYHSPFFAYQRPLFRTYPHDTVADYWHQAFETVTDPGQVLVVAEDEYLGAEAEAEGVVDDVLRECIYHGAGEGGRVCGSGNFGNHKGRP